MKRFFRFFKVRLDGFFELTLKPWDVAAGSLIAAEAGAALSDFEGGEGYLLGQRLVACTPQIQRQLLEMLAAAHAQPECWPLGEPLSAQPLTNPAQEASS